MSSASKRMADSSDEESSEGEGEDDFMSPPEAAAGVAGAANIPQRTKQIRKEKRLAMNRESARARRKRTKIRLETLEQRAEELSQRHHNLVLTNQGLKTRLAQLEAELTITTGRAGVGIGRSVLGGATAGMLSGPGGNDSAIATGTFGSPSEALMLGQQLMTTGAGAAAAGSAASLPSRGMSNCISDQELHFLQLQQLMIAQQQPGHRPPMRGGSGASAAARAMALQDTHAQVARTNQLSALRAGGASGMGRGGHINAVSNFLRYLIPFVSHKFTDNGAYYA
jgi:bZIP transcription factor